MTRRRKEEKEYVDKKGDSDGFPPAVVAATVLRLRAQREKARGRCGD